MGLLYYIKTELTELERMALPWIFVLLSNSVSVMAVQALVRAFDEQSLMRVRVCLFLSWYTHTVPARMQLPLRRMRLDNPFKPDYDAPNTSQPWVYRTLGIILNVVCFVLSVAWPASESTLTHTVAWLIGLGAMRHSYHTLMFRYPSKAAVSVDVLCKFWSSLLSYLTAISFYFVMSDTIHFGDESSPMLAFALLWPVLRHFCRWIIFRVLINPLGTRGTVRVFVSMSTDLPLFISIYTRRDMRVVFMMVVYTALVDCVAVQVLSWSNQQRMFSLSNMPWIHFIAISFLFNLRTEQFVITLSSVAERCWYAVLYMFVFCGLLLLVSTIDDMRSPAKVVQSDNALDEEPEIVDETCCGWRSVPVFHTNASHLEHAHDSLDFSDSAVPQSLHMHHLLQVVGQSDAVCLLMWACYLITGRH